MFTREPSRMRMLQLILSVAFVLAAVAGLVYLAMRYLDLLAKPYYALKRGRELSADACAFTEDDMF